MSVTTSPGVTPAAPSVVMAAERVDGDVKSRMLSVRWL